MGDNRNKINNRFNCLKSSDTDDRTNRFKTPQKTK